LSFVLPGEHCVKAIPLLKQIQKVFVQGPAGNNGRDLRLLWVSCFEICQLFRQSKKSLAHMGEAFSFDAWQSPTWM
jgi:hypothetical protein